MGGVDSAGSHPLALQTEVGLHTLRRSRQNHVLVILAYLLVALVLTWPVAALFTTHVPGNGVDDPPLTWNLWWVKYALLDLGTNPFQCDYLFHPLGINLAFYTLTVLNGLLSIPLQAGLAALGQAGGIVTASNLLLLSSFVLGAYGTFLLANYILGPRDQGRVARDFEPPASPSETDPAWPGTQHRPHRTPGYPLQWAPFAAGLIYAFASSKLAYAALGQWNIASSQWIPFYVLYLLLMTEQPRQRRYALMAALFLLFQAYAELTYATFLVLFTGLWWAWLALARLRGRKVALLPLFVDLLLLGAIFLLGLAPMLAMMVPDMLVEGNLLVEGGGFADVFSADLLGYFVPTMYHPIFGGLVTRFGFDYSVGQHIYLGYSLLVLIIMTGVWVPAARRRHPDPGARDAGSPATGKSVDGPPASPGTGREETALRQVQWPFIFLLDMIAQSIREYAHRPRGEAQLPRDQDQVDKSRTEDGVHGGLVLLDDIASALVDEVERPAGSDLHSALGIVADLQHYVLFDWRIYARVDSGARFVPGGPSVPGSEHGHEVNDTYPHLLRQLVRVDFDRYSGQEQPELGHLA